MKNKNIVYSINRPLSFHSPYITPFLVFSISFCSLLWNSSGCFFLIWMVSIRTRRYKGGNFWKLSQTTGSAFRAFSISASMTRRYSKGGAAFGMLQGQKVFFVLIAVTILAVIVYVLLKTPYQKMYTKLHISLIFIASGAIGNLIDRLKFGYVVDFLYFSLINFPVFNVADICVTLSSIYLVFLLVFVYKESDLEFLTFRTKKFRDIK